MVLWTGCCGNGHCTPCRSDAADPKVCHEGMHSLDYGPTWHTCNIYTWWINVFKCQNYFEQENSTALYAEMQRLGYLHICLVIGNTINVHALGVTGDNIIWTFWKIALISYLLHLYSSCHFPQYIWCYCSNAPLQLLIDRDCQTHQWRS